MKTVMIATPCHDGKLDVRYVDSLLNTMRTQQDKYKIVPVFAPGDANVCKVRNYLLKIAADADVDDILWVDSDMAWDPPSFFKILDDDADYVGALCRLKQDEQVLSLRLLKGSDGNPRQDGLLEVDGIGLAFTKMSKACYMQLYKKAREYTIADFHGRDVFENTIDKGEYSGEDITACHKWRAIRGKVFADTMVAVAHIGTKVYLVDMNGKAR